MKTAQDMIDSITSQIQSEIAKAEKATLANHVSMRRITLNAIRELWDIAAVTPQKSAEVGNVVYVSKSEANKYGRYGKLESQIVASNTSGLSIDKSVVERTGATVYQSQYNGSAWVYQQGYELPVTGSARAKLIANALYSDFSGDTFEGYLKSNWSKYTNDILSTVTRALNQGKSYAQIAREVRDLADANYARSLRVAATEAHRIQSQAQMDSIALLDEVDVAYVKMWVASIDDKTRESHQYMDGKYADKDGVFHLPSGATGPEPGLTGVASEDINCRCTSILVIDGQAPTERRIRGEGIVPYETYLDRLSNGGNIPMRDIRAQK